MKRKQTKDKCDGIDCAWCVAVNCPKEGDYNMEPKNPIIIDGVDVSGCKYYDDLDCYAERDSCGYPLDCKDNPNCYFKQLTSKTYECEKLKLDLTEAKAHGDYLNNLALSETLNLVNEQFNQLKAEKEQAEQKLKQIEKLCIKNSSKSSFFNGIENKDMQKLAIRVLQIIDEVE